MIGDTEDRPWGSWTVLDEGDGFKVKRIHVDPHSRLSYQTHEHRAEHWVIAAGRCTAIIDGETVVAGPGSPSGSRSAKHTASPTTRTIRWWWSKCSSAPTPARTTSAGSRTTTVGLRPPPTEPALAPDTDSPDSLP